MVKHIMFADLAKTEGTETHLHVYVMGNMAATVPPHSINKGVKRRPNSPS